MMGLERKIALTDDNWKIIVPTPTDPKQMTAMHRRCIISAPHGVKVKA